MHFKVKGVPYFLNFVPEQGRWLLYQATPTGIRRISLVDDARLGSSGFLFAPQSGEGQPVN